MAAVDDLASAGGGRGMIWRVVVTGSECTGKTTLAREIAARLGSPCIEEASRAYAEARGGVLSAADVEPIAREQISAQAQAQTNSRTIVCDTDLVSTMVYAREYYGSCPVWIEAACGENRGDLYLLCAPDIPWVADGVRDRPSTVARAEMHEAFARALRELGVRVVLIEGSGNLRIERTMAAVRAAHASVGASA